MCATNEHMRLCAHTAIPKCVVTFLVYVHGIHQSHVAIRTQSESSSVLLIGSFVLRSSFRSMPVKCIPIPTYVAYVLSSYLRYAREANFDVFVWIACC